MKGIIRFFAFSLVLSFVFSCTNNRSNSIRIGVLQGPSYVSFLEMMENPPVIEGKNIEFVMKNDPQQIQAMMINHELDCAVLPTVMAANLYNKGLGYNMVACPVWGTLYLITNDSSVQSLNDVSGKKIYVFGQGATPDVLLTRFLKKNYIKDTNTDYTFSNNADISAAFMSKKIALAVISEPLVSMLMQKDSSNRIVSKINCEDFLYNSDKDIFVQTAFVVNNNFAYSYPESLRTICEAYSSSCNFVNDEPAKTARLMVKYGIVSSSKSAMISIPLCNIRYVAAFAVDHEIEKYLRIFYDINPESVGGSIPDRNFIYQPQ